MARQTNSRDISPILAAAEQWLRSCLVEDHSMFSSDNLWTPSLVEGVRQAFVERPDFGDDSFVAKLKKQMLLAPPAVQRLTAEMLWALLLFPSNTNARTKRQQIREIWALSGNELAEDHPLLTDDVLVGVGSGGPGFNNYRPDELTFLIELTTNLKRRQAAERKKILHDYAAFMEWIASVPRKGSRQFRHMLRFFTFPDCVERISSNNDRRKILEAFDISSAKSTKSWTDQKLDEALSKLRDDLQAMNPSLILDFYEPPLRERWAGDRKVSTATGTVTVVVPTSDEDDDHEVTVENGSKVEPARQSIQIQAKLAEIGAAMGLDIWLPKSDKGRVNELVSEQTRQAFLEKLPLNYDEATLDTIEQIDVLWIRRRSIVRAFEVEHTTAVYSGLLRMADLLALQPNMDIRLHIVAPDERREKVFREMLRPVFSLLEKGPLSNTCTFISYESVNAIRDLEHLAHTHETIVAKYEERCDEG